MRHIIYNITIILTFAALALYFSKWWIILFALFFMVTGTAFKKTNAKHCRVCDVCGRRSESAETAEEAIQRAERCGWSHVEKGNLDVCPDCRNKVSR